MVVIRTNGEALRECFGNDWNRTIQDFSRVIGFSFEGEDKTDIKIELNPDRADLYSVESIHNQLEIFARGVHREGRFLSGNLKTTIKEVASRPFFIAFETDGISQFFHGNRLCSDFLEFSDRVSESVGKARRKFAIGVHDREKVIGEISYSSISKDETMTTYDGLTGKISDLLNEHEKGIKYQALNSLNKVFAVSDESGIMSVPPFFNSYRTRTTSETKKLLVDITATSQQGLDLGFRLMAGYFLSKGIDVTIPASFSNYAGMLNSKKIEVSDKRIRKMTGLGKLDKDEIKKSLSKMGISYSNGQCKVPLGRVDLMGEADIIEDFIKGYGINKIEEKALNNNFMGTENEMNKASNSLRNIMVSLGFQEVKNFVLGDSSSKHQFFKVNNPKSIEFSKIRENLFQSVLSSLEKNKAEPFPQNIFEVGDSIDTSGKQKTLMACIMSGNSASYDAMKGVLEAILRSVEIENLSIRETETEELIRGRAGEIMIGDKPKSAGLIGEVDPIIIDKFKIPFPATYLELNLEDIISKARAI